ncbi:uncharacterized protein LOC131240378 [Magnolia sinica]|uniref:uncharacterized protein LOC131240378 n=1 Tax=Magnolia sinica TaxID=86752 RepID=UPI00265B681A|nr:uncharacterized protein LOC131240378 [Magnolia sinica]XP_058094545.1 uncharacterized protein LOC131240378 [Magnolia sinica]XP_058094546.1 uncharacterized protein LOC131240378 [Magnolia sinica]XP_058094548.1 uncharacterized protein LOC131240378 [Magnolia sinica]XP_058094549.1 uncharacterized protein LOC131240378 [Magnolia sinica]
MHVVRCSSRVISDCFRHDYAINGGNSKASKQEFQDLHYFPSGSQIRLQISRFMVLCRVLVSSNLLLVLRRVQNKRQRTEPSSPLLLLEFHAISSSSLSLRQLLRLIFKALIESEYEKSIFAVLYEGQGGPVQSREYFASTGARLNGKEMIAEGLATHFVPSELPIHLKEVIGEINATGLVDAGFSGNKFTWYNNQFGNARVWARLDRVLLNTEWMNSFPLFRVDNFL